MANSSHEGAKPWLQRRTGQHTQGLDTKDFGQCDFYLFELIVHLGRRECRKVGMGPRMVAERVIAGIEAFDDINFDFIVDASVVGTYG